LITLSQARTVVHRALEYAREHELPPMTIAVLDAAGDLVAFVRKIGRASFASASPG